MALRRLREGSVDLICCDPPYGISFMQKDWDRAVPPVDVWRECLRVLKPGAFAFIMCTPRQDCLARMILNLEEAGFCTNFTSIYWVYSQGFPKAQNLSKQADKRAGAKRKVVGLSSQPNNKSAGYQGARYKESRTTRFGVVQDQPNKTAPSTEAAQRLDGAYAGFQPKPAVEPIIVVMKPLDTKTYLDQAVDNGKGCTWLDDGRIPADPVADATQVGRVMQRGSREQDSSGQKWGMNKGGADRPTVVQESGRFPANVLVEDDALNTEMNSESLSRYFDLDAWWKKRIEELPAAVRDAFPCLYVYKSAKREKQLGLGAKILNDHPTVKPVKLMSYLVTIGSRSGDVVLDPYMGSGTTGIAALLLQRRFWGVELNQHYYKIAEKRLDYVEALLDRIPPNW